MITPNFNIDTDVEVATASVATTNHPLPGTLKAMIRAQIDSEKQQLVFLDEEIHRTQALLDKLRQQHTHRSTQLKRYQMCIASHRDLPREILSEIFLWSLAQWGVPVPRRDTDAPWNIIHVCSLWRQLALNMPKLWARVDLNITGPDSTGLNIRTLQGVIGASKNFPLFIRAYLPPHNLQRAFGIIFSDIHRLREITLRGHLDCIEPFLNLPAGLAKSLEIVTVGVSVPPGTLDDSMTDSELSILKGSTKLRELTLDILVPYSSIIQLPLAQLTALHLPCSKLHPRAALSILRQCPSIIQCTLGLTNDGDDAPPDTTPCLLPELTHLALRPCGSTRFDYPQSLVLPRLTHLSLTYRRSIPGSAAARNQWISKFSTVQFLELDTPLSRQDVKELLRASPSLTELSVPRGAFSASCLEDIASGALLPKVRKLTCMINTLHSFHAHLDMLERRKSESSHAAHIAEVTFVNRSGLKESELSGSARCKEMVTKGWNIGFMKNRQ